ncbi:unnamed protein product [Gordionus sp. m RMFG-2023]|uniref:death domain-associated protein 6-like isoform X2 n=1 Tax=Gordionus sp. m RMFG-2023 TaxID=3053472 RepID=UPI0030E5D271
MKHLKHLVVDLVSSDEEEIVEERIIENSNPELLSIERFIKVVSNFLEQKNSHLAELIKQCLKNTSPKIFENNNLQNLFKDIRKLIENNLPNQTKQIYFKLFELSISLNTDKNISKLNPSKQFASQIGPDRIAGTKSKLGPKQINIELLKDRQNRINRLENELKQLENAIKENREKELDFNDLDNEYSPYIVEDKLERKALNVWRLIRKLKGRSFSCGRVIREKLSFKVTDYPEINSAIEKMINQASFLFTFPDYADIRNIVTEKNLQKGLNIAPIDIESISLSAFKSVGQLLKDRRGRDFKMDFGSHLMDNVDLSNDPYHTHDHPDLVKLLERNYQLAQEKMDQLTSMYVLKENFINKSKEEESFRLNSSSISSGKKEIPIQTDEEIVIMEDLTSETVLVATKSYFDPPLKVDEIIDNKTISVSTNKVSNDIMNQLAKTIFSINLPHL